MRSYNPAMDSMISNYRDLASKRFLKTDMFSNEQLYAMIQECGTAPDGETQNEWFIETLMNHLAKL